MCDFIAGWISGMVGLVVGHPVDTVKVVQQTRGIGILECIKQLVWNVQFTHSNHNHAVKNFFRGLGTPLLSNGAMNSIFFGVYGSVLDNIMQFRMQSAQRNRNDQNSVYYRPTISECFWAGWAGGWIQLIISCPVDVIKVKLQYEQNRNVLKGPLDCIAQIVKQHGVKGLYQGAFIMAVRDGPASGFYMALYEGGRDYLPINNDHVKALTAGGIAGVISWWSVVPLDVIKSRIQAQNLSNPNYSGVWDCGSKILAEHGAKGFFRGFWPLTIRAFIVNSTTFLAYESILASPTCQKELKGKLNSNNNLNNSNDNSLLYSDSNNSENGNEKYRRR